MQEGEEGEDQEEFFDVEMTIDDDLFDQNSEEIEEGMFVSFKYTGEYSKGLGRPMNPKVSFLILINNERRSHNFDKERYT